MLIINLPGTESYNQSTEEFVYSEPFVLELEHSLVTLSKWESEWEKPFLAPGEKSNEEVLGYVRAMIQNPEVPEDLFVRLTKEHFEKIDAYINAKMTATWFSEHSKPPPRSRETITNELVYYWLMALNIPFDPVQNWHLSRLFTLIRVVNAKSSKPKKMSSSEIAARNRELNARRLAELGTTG